MHKPVGMALFYDQNRLQGFGYKYNNIQTPGPAIELHLIIGKKKKRPSDHHKGEQPCMLLYSSCPQLIICTCSVEHQSNGGGEVMSAVSPSSQTLGITWRRKGGGGQEKQYLTPRWVTVSVILYLLPSHCSLIWLDNLHWLQIFIYMHKQERITGFYGCNV
jgi:hypothetical protein